MVIRRSLRGRGTRFYVWLDAKDYVAGNWPNYRFNYDGNRHSPLTYEIERPKDSMHTLERIARNARNGVNATPEQYLAIQKLIIENL
jgi:hypothetical protein